MMFYPSRFASQTELSASELFAISDRISKIYSPIVSIKSFGVAKKVSLSPKELFEVSEEITRKYTPQKTYSAPNFVLLPIDPEHLYVSWNLPRSQIASASKDKTEEIVLRIYPKADETPKLEAGNEWFDIALDQAKKQQSVAIPKEQRADTFSAAIGIREQDNHLILLAKSNVIHKPRGNISDGTSGDDMTVPSGSSQIFALIQEKPPDTNIR